MVSRFVPANHLWTLRCCRSLKSCAETTAITVRETWWYVAEVGSLYCSVIHHRLVTRILAIFILMRANRAIHRREDRLSSHTIQDCSLPDDEAKVETPLVVLLLRVAAGEWSFASIVPEVVPRMQGLVSQSESPYSGDYPPVCTPVLCCAG